MVESEWSGMRAMDVIPNNSAALRLTAKYAVLYVYALA